MKQRGSFFGGFASSIVELKLATNRLAEGKGLGAGGFTVKYQLLYLIASNNLTSPAELIYELNMAKSNLALLAKKMINEGLIESVKEASNKKQIYYRITEQGLKELRTKMNAIDNMVVADKDLLSHLNKTVEDLKNLK